jgi:hypothetical protein
LSLCAILACLLRHTRLIPQPSHPRGIVSGLGASPEREEPQQQLLFLADRCERTFDFRTLLLDMRNPSADLVQGTSDQRFGHLNPVFLHARNPEITMIAVL